MSGTNALYCAEGGVMGAQRQYVRVKLPAEAMRRLERDARASDTTPEALAADMLLEALELAEEPAPRPVEAVA